MDNLLAVQARGDSGVYCLDFILASVDYGSFIALVSDFSDLFDWSLRGAADGEVEPKGTSNGRCVVGEKDTDDADLGAGKYK